MAPLLFKIGLELIRAAAIDSQETIYTAGETVDEGAGETVDEGKAREERVLEYKSGVNSIVLCLEGLAKKYGFQIRTTADKFRDLATQAEILQEQLAP
jgi:hypothetical protein